MKIAQYGFVVYGKTRSFLKQNRNYLFWAFVSTFIFGLVAHAYGVFNYTLAFDGLSHFYYGEFFDGINLWKIQIGRWFVPIYKAVFNINITVPWVQFVIATIWVTISVFLIVKIFNLKSRLSVLIISGFLITNIAVTAQTATFLFELDANLFAMMLTVISVFLWSKYNKLQAYIVSVVLLTISLGIYQSYLSVSITLVIVYSILSLLNNEKVHKVIINGMKYIGVIIVSIILYLLMVFIMTKVYHTEYISNYNTINTGIFGISSLFQSSRAFLFCVQSIFQPLTFSNKWVLSVVSFAACLIAIIFSVVFAKHKQLKIGNILLILFLIILMPLGMNFTFVLMGGWVHSLMVYAFSLFWVFIIILLEKTSKGGNLKRALRLISVGLLFVLIGNNIFFANGLYVEKKLQEDATLAQMTNVVNDIRHFEGYDSDKHELILVGQSVSYNDTKPFEKLNDVFGFARTIEWDTNTDGYFKYVLHFPIKVASGEEFQEIRADSRIKEMPSYPNEGYIMQTDKYLVVKLSDY